MYTIRLVSIVLALILVESISYFLVFFFSSFIVPSLSPERFKYIYPINFPKSYRADCEYADDQIQVTFAKLKDCVSSAERKDIEPHEMHNLQTKFQDLIESRLE